MNVRDALADISAIRAQIARSETFRGYRSATVAFSGALAVACAVVQAFFIPQPAEQSTRYLTLWLTAAALSIAVTAAELAYRCHRARSPLVTQLTWLAVEQFLPCVIAGALVTAVLVSSAPQTLWMLPGLWALLFGLGVFSSSRLLPSTVFWVALYYFVAGTVCLLVGQGLYAFSPWLMAGTFGPGQFMSAAILYWHLERQHG